MISIPYTFTNEDESYITIPALKRFAKEKRNEDLRTTLDRAQLLNDIKNYANQSEEKKEEVLDWLDQVLVEGIKEVQIKFLDDSMPIAFLNDDSFVDGILSPILVDNSNCHLCATYSDKLSLFRYEIVSESEFGRRIKLYLGKLLCTYDKRKKALTVPYPIFVEIFVDKGIIVARAKSKAGMYKYMDPFDLDDAVSTTADKQMGEAVKYVCTLFAMNTATNSEASRRFKRQLYFMLEKYTETPSEIQSLMDNRTAEIEQMVELLTENICHLPHAYKADVQSNVLNMVEKYFSISYPDKNIFTKDREAYPLRLNATDEEDSRVEQAAAWEEPLQSKAIFFDNKKMLQKSKACDGVSFAFYRKNTLYCKPRFCVKISVYRDHCILKFTEYTMEEDIINVLFSLIGTTGATE